jgi:hypothetical protein
MSQTVAGITEKAGSERPDSHLWVRCRGCKGEVGVPQDWQDATVECPSCREVLQVRGKILYRPPVEAKPAAAPPQMAPARPSAEDLATINRKAEVSLVWGLLSIFLGWTFFVPLLGFCYYCDTFSLANKAKVPVPGKGFAGMLLSLLMGGLHLAVLIARMSR